MAMQPSELYALEVQEFLSVYEGWRKRQEQLLRQQWEVARYQACAIISPWMDGNKSMAELLPLPWDERPAEVLDYDPTDMEARAERVKQLMKNKDGNWEVSEPDN